MAGLERFQGRDVGVLGLGTSGRAIARSLMAAGARVVAFDDDGQALQAFTSASGCRAGVASDVAGLACLVASPGVPLTFPAPHPVIVQARAAGIPITGDLQLFIDSLDFGQLVGITGTNGKSTTTALIHHLLQAAGRNALVGGNIGKPVATLCDVGNDTVLVLELSSYQLDLCSDLPSDVAVLLNLTPDHLDRHGTFEGYVAAKRRLFSQQRPGAAAVIGIEDEPSSRLARDLADQRRLVRIASTAVGGADVYVADGELIDAMDGNPKPVADLRPIETLRGRHNHQNAAAAYAAVRLLGLRSDEAVLGFAGFQGLPHRMEEVARAGDVRFVNDSKATNPEAACRSLVSFERIYWIVGGRAKPGGFASLLSHLGAVQHAYLIGEAEDELAEAFDGKLDATRCGTLDVATQSAWSALRMAGHSDATVLLAPACASFDQFRSFEARGERFGEIARSIADRNGASGAAA